MIAIVDYGVGNLFSLSSSLSKLGIENIITNKQQDFEDATHIILPGVGAFGDAMAKLEATGLIPCLKEQAANGKPLLGICLGMQILFEEGFEYGCHKGLGLIKGSVCALEPDLKAGGFDYKVPHMGWNALKLLKPESPIMKNTKPGDYMYFVHSYYAKNCDEALVATAEYGVDVPATVSNGNVYGCQFHPEKSGEKGLLILKAFAEL